ncbi:aminotransferase class IV [Allorhizobium sp. BGMRC 0089]|uniref:aminotransferase class IV n=1 Tax=Allorhizobium sonneratiae TaxID=2934936 RepID=UPI0020344BD7|nr:aminotransferase class IV [Allorhizobium sonneratiae]MCM2292332.1 aminotransferase class IV [Allorhizobium sonneratiae]
MNIAAASNTSSQGYVADHRNDDVLIYLNGDFFKRDEAKVSVFDAGFVLGDGVWEGVRLVNGKIIALDEHLDRLYEGANSIELDIGMSRDELTEALWQTFRKNDMTDGAHARLMVTRGKKKTPNQDPRFAMGKPTIVIVAEFKIPKPESKSRGLSLMTSTIRCSTPDVFDLRLNSHSRLNFIHALIQAINCGADEALMLDPHGFVASCNSTNFFIIRGEELWTSTGRYNFNGITRKKVIKLYQDAGYVVREKDFTLAEVYSASEAFVTGTLGGITPVTRIDGRIVGAGQPGAVTQRIAALYDAYLRG